ncbi:4-diphosphocytidyl-2-C-methyl-D-erythritol kinase [Caldicellulosiruptor bescii]|uniref:4-diphosphocytidyl-2-C-methyl-D-erythritol kinase n=2 Tax=Caldicellulosiruptor bescii TaxID=31899 RepID=ISPE_CALBD|nr:4-(cytidine 5'-diphospho)-2-C-methyl-D-erythritol kinase [Caldicellulosiruptor bescii]B9MJX8.1 RecName: Full=4-diphosphocytidyl-2-C-methyl-D-erythritol kinase; Short=CMK; AltName: Full=4-(cytidine-5'-diphospho)-2-C-methyl-D-erythritol kinase [Caldicellulosiruptor bescii DSM 6725]ACM60636.1 4-diphosphocytidyl-2C-methyl-D-erythritol kinase [Caldicellulosiruptor bescii DSM 6725]PBC88045.1 4-diphosphocytidyl-2-C-methyl-D-erythritol kinase [Caldicellulosiruptor bescii]PBC90977.1 4-diphosphocytidy
MKLKAYAKINLALDVLSKREDGYHEIRTIMQTVDLYDIINIEKIEEDNIIVTTSSENIPTDNKNHAYIAASLLKERFGVKQGVRIHIEKNIPVSAGLAGGSTDAAAVLKGLNEIFELNLSEQQLMEIGREIGADVPFCLVGGTALCEGIGEKVIKLKSAPQMNILIAKPEVYVSTQAVYEALDLSKIKKRPNIEAMISAIEEGNVKEIAKNLCNVLEVVTVNQYPVINRVKDIMRNNNALGTVMTGSGPAVFGIFGNKYNALKAAERLKVFIKEIILTTTCEGSGF